MANLAASRRESLPRSITPQQISLHFAASVVQRALPKRIEDRLKMTSVPIDIHAMQRTGNTLHGRNALGQQWVALSPGQVGTLIHQ